MSLPKRGDRIRKKGGLFDGPPGQQVFSVEELFPGSGQYLAMLLRWHDGVRPRGQAFTTKDFDEHWEILPKEQE